MIYRIIVVIDDGSDKELSNTDCQQEAIRWLKGYRSYPEFIGKDIRIEES